MAGRTENVHGPLAGDSWADLFQHINETSLKDLRQRLQREHGRAPCRSVRLDVGSGKVGLVSACERALFGGLPLDQLACH